MDKTRKIIKGSIPVHTKQIPCFEARALPRLMSHLPSPSFVLPRCACTPLRLIESMIRNCFRAETKCLFCLERLVPLFQHYGFIVLVLLQSFFDYLQLGGHPLGMFRVVRGYPDSCRKTKAGDIVFALNVVCSCKFDYFGNIMTGIPALAIHF